ncbi:hypothetical protein [Microbacterium esteraromaticum]|uniref:hypothetical protein n=1 Tax=Microbacterium esteraromaticum TaxID=57043 RepID=UPI000B34AA23|nr:hypothetical protein [Microbacterium esteraromaticum]
MSSHNKAGTSAASRAGNSHAIVSFTLSIIATVITWISAYGAPQSARSAAAAGDYANVYTFLIISLGLATALNVVALVTGISAARRRVRLLLAGAGIALSATGLIGTAINLATAFLLPF